MKVTEHTHTRLVFNGGLPYVAAFRCEFDRATGHARINRTEFFVRRKPVDLAIADIAAAKTWTENSGGESSYALLGLFTKSGECVRLPMPSYGNTSSFNKVVALVNGFLAG